MGQTREIRHQIQSTHTALTSTEGRKHYLILIPLVGLSPLLSSACLKPWDSRAWNLRALEAQHRSSSPQFSPETVPSRKASPSGTGHDWEEDFKGFGCSVHINIVGNLCTISRGNLKIPVWVLGFIFLVCVLSPRTEEADPLIKAFIKLAELSFSPSLSYPVWMLIIVITQFILNEMLTMIPTLTPKTKLKTAQERK